MKNTINDLIKIADALDAKGFAEEAAFVDSLIKEAGDRTRAVQTFMDELKKEFGSAAKSTSTLLTINEKSLPEILQVIDSVAEGSSFMNPDASPETMRNLEDQAITVSEGIVASEEYLKQLQELIDKETDEDKKRGLVQERPKIEHRLKELKALVDAMKSGRRPGDKEKYEYIKKFVNEKLGREEVR